MCPYTICFSNQLLLDGFFLALRRRFGPKVSRSGELFYCQTPLRELADSLAAFVFGRREELRLWQLVYDDFADFDFAEKSRMVARSRQLLAGEARQKRLAALLRLHLAEQGYLDLEAFLTFRLAGYDEYLTGCLITAAGEVLSAREDAVYRDFLRRFTADRSGQKDLELILDGNAYCLMADTPPRLKEGGRLRDLEDELLARLLWHAPDNLTLHIRDDAQANIIAIAQVLRDALGPKLRICRDCQLCRPFWFDKNIPKEV